jgi:hypothetical protein
VSNGKGSRYRPVDGETYRHEHDRIFARTPPPTTCSVCGLGVRAGVGLWRYPGGSWWCERCAPPSSAPTGRAEG